MQSRKGRLALAGLVIVVAVVAFFIAQPKSKKGKPLGTVAAQIVVRAAKPGGVKTITVSKGQQLQLTVTSDVADEIHIHGYDLKKDVSKGGSASFVFPANIDGSFVIELEKRAQQIGALQVRP